MQRFSLKEFIKEEKKSQTTTIILNCGILTGNEVVLNIETPNEGGN